MQNIFTHKELIFTIFQEKSFSRAAQKLFISQPSLSTIVKRLEEEIGLPLFDRTCKPIRLTEAGEEYIKAAADIRHIENSFIGYVQAVNQLQAGSLHIGSNQLMSSLILPRYISEFVKRYPQIRLTLLDANTTELQNQIMTGQLDMIIDNHELEESLFEKRFLREEQLLLAVPRDFPCNRELSSYCLSYEEVKEDRHKAADCPVPPLSAFARLPFILMTRDNDTRGRTDLIFQQEAFSPHSIFEVDRLVTLYNFLDIGTAASVVSDTLVKNIHYSGERIVFYKLGSPLARRPIYISYKRNKYYSKAMEAFTALLYAAP